MMRARSLSLSLSLPRTNLAIFFIPALALALWFACETVQHPHARRCGSFSLVGARAAWRLKRAATSERERVRSAVAECAWHFLRAARKTAVTLSDKSMPDANSSLGGRFIAHFVIGRARLRPGNLTSACLPAPPGGAHLHSAICLSPHELIPSWCAVLNHIAMCWFFTSSLSKAIIGCLHRNTTLIILEKCDLERESFSFLIRFKMFGFKSIDIHFYRYSTFLKIITSLIFSFWFRSKID
jgi:hypothetical protein